MSEENNNYFFALREHADLCENKLNYFSKKLAANTLSDDDYFAIERLLQILIEAAIGVSKHMVRAYGQTPLVSAYDNFQILADHKVLSSKELATWKSIVGLRNVLLHDYLRVDRNIVTSVLKKHLYLLVSAFIKKRSD